jgi:hypothetical protein
LDDGEQPAGDAGAAHASTVAEWLHGYFQRHGIDGQQFAPVNLTPVEPVPAAPVDDLCRLTESAARLAETSDRMPKGLPLVRHHGKSAMQWWSRPEKPTDSLPSGSAGLPYRGAPPRHYLWGGEEVKTAF